jgi:phosphoribosylaminoimidazole-succinocarboxamide synthase
MAAHPVDTVLAACIGSLAMEALTHLEIGQSPVASGKVREIFDLGERLLIVATDRISAFDVVMPNGIPGRGKVLTKLSVFWFNLLKELVPHHFLWDGVESLPEAFRAHEDVLEGRFMIVRKTAPLPVECVVRGYLAGAGWREYRETGSLFGHHVVEDLRESDRLPGPVFTPTTKTRVGHDVPLSQSEVEELVGRDTARWLEETSLELYEKGLRYALPRGVVLADTKFEFGRLGDDLLLIDEVFTPDSSRFWPREDYEPGRSQRSFDKQFVRDYLEALDWDKRPPAPTLPPDVVQRTAQLYREALRRLTGQDL